MRRINEAYGVAVGDAVLERMAALLKTCLREYDLLARLEGDEFAVLLPGADVVAGRTVAERMVNLVAGAKFDEQQPALQVTASAGAVLWMPPSGESGRDILRRAGDALDRARSQGPAVVEVEGALAT